MPAKKKSAKKKAKEAARKSDLFALRINDAMRAEIDRVAEERGISKAMVIKQAVQLGLPRLERMFEELKHPEGPLE